MKKILKLVGIVLGGLIGLLVIAVIFMIVSTNNRLNKQYTVTAETITIPTDEAGIANGAHWADIHCHACHGDDLSGGEFFNDPQLGYVDAPNLTSGQGGVGRTNTDEDWVRAIRHGVKSDGTSVFIMRANDFYYLSDYDLGSIIAHVKSVPPVDNEIRPQNLSPMAKVLYALGAFGDLLYAETIQHDVRPASAETEVGVTAEYGEYLVNAHGCKSCHGENLAGGQPAEPGAPLAPNLTPGGELIGWSEEDFFTTLRTGVVPTGRTLSDSMPWLYFSKMTDDEITAVWLYLQSQPALETNEP
jgi:mono/diheme cytochrome c family protein